MFSLVLDATNNIIRAVMAAPAATNNPQFSSHYADNDGTTFVEGSEGGVLNGTTNVTLVTAPAASTRRIVKSIALYNADTAAVTVNIQYFDGTNARTIANVTLAVGDTWTLEGTFNSSGAMKTTGGGGGTPGGSTTQVQYNNAGSFGGITNATTDGTTLSMTSPKIITGINDTNANELIKFTATASAVNEITVANAATTTNPVISATGGDTNIGITLTPKGTGNLVLTTGNVVVANGNGIDFSATAGTGTSELLNDYEEGTFTPGISFGGGTTGIIYTGQTGGLYTKVGRLVTAYGRVELSSKGSSSGDALVTGLPFTSSASFQWSSAPLKFDNISFSNVFQSLMINSSTSIILQEVTNAGVRTQLDNTDFANNSVVVFSIAYVV